MVGLLVVRQRDHALEALFGRRRGVVIGVVHVCRCRGRPSIRASR